MEKENMQEEMHFKHMPRSDEAIKNLQSRLNKIIGQLNGVKKMIDENRYCVDIITQLSACEKSIHSVSLLMFKDHLETCATEKIKAEDANVIDELMFILKTMK